MNAFFHFYAIGCLLNSKFQNRISANLRLFSLDWYMQLRRKKKGVIAARA
jgi:hypothetical protein